MRPRDTPCVFRLGSRPRSSVILLHGYMSCAGAHREDAFALAAETIEVVVPDAPGHGSREDGRQERIGALPEKERHAAILEISREWLGELPRLARWCRDRGAGRVGLVGISMGGYASLAALAGPCSFDVVVAVLAAPTLLDRSRATPGRPPLLIGLAGRDEVVPAEPGRQFAHEYGAALHEYPESQHVMRVEDWSELWGRTATFLHAHLGG